MASLAKKARKTDKQKAKTQSAEQAEIAEFKIPEVLEPRPLALITVEKNADFKEWRKRKPAAMHRMNFIIDPRIVHAITLRQWQTHVKKLDWSQPSISYPPLPELDTERLRQAMCVKKQSGEMLCDAKIHEILRQSVAAILSFNDIITADAQSLQCITDVVRNLFDNLFKSWTTTIHASKQHQYWGSKKNIFQSVLEIASISNLNELLTTHQRQYIQRYEDIVAKAKNLQSIIAARAEKNIQRQEIKNVDYTDQTNPTDSLLSQRPESAQSSSTSSGGQSASSSASELQLQIDQQ